MNFNLDTHLVQTLKWSSFKTAMGTKSVRVDEIQFTKHKIPFTSYYIGYAPRVNFFKQKFSWKELMKVAQKEKCAVIRFDVPNVLVDQELTTKQKQTLDSVKKHCKRSPRSTFAQYNVFLDLKPSLKELSANCKSKTRYNSKLSARKGVEIKVENNNRGIKIFNKLHTETANRDKFLRHSDRYYKKAFESFPQNAHILIAYLKNELLGAWMLFTHNKTLYYPYGASSNRHRNLMASNLLGWEAIKLGKELNCEIFDMWGATNNENDHWWGFTKFKLGYGGQLVKYIDSYDYVVNPLIMTGFNSSYSLFWKLRNFAKVIYR